jgi:two-component system, response regulator PdtaR
MFSMQYTERRQRVVITFLPTEKPEPAVLHSPVALVVEDEFLVQDWLHGILVDLGFETVVASNADDALKVLEERPDMTLVITDIEMPGSMDGLKLASVIRTRWPPTRLIITTARLRPARLPERAHFLSKPYSEADIAQAIALVS